MVIQHVERIGSYWGVRGDDSEEFAAEFPSESEAVHYAWHAAGVGGQVIVHEDDGSTEVFVRTGFGRSPAET